ncbi:sugar transferase [Calothrix parasitica NIES-267]|uniref:Sugar transferase n=1 Tax=Calothrix parasitica NIES-267 TaxID=1973488 RepID=A0A1Z4LZZ9_9CYAN|nr:sugar transferase [Calothrix parasitica NIES-267]
MIAQELQDERSQRISRAIKSVLDRVVAATALLLLSPIILIVSIAINFRMGSPLIFSQPRPGKDGKIFRFYKFRTMTDERDAEGNLLDDELRMTAFGEFLRESSLDELPQLWNVVKGDMSIVGPRPLLVQYLERYTPEQARRHEVKPGITGWAQINGRRLLDGNWEKKFRLDVWYVDNWSLWLDLKIILMTVGKVLRKEEISQPGHATGAEFMGSKAEG